jgi:hypothetical protein
MRLCFLTCLLMRDPKHVPNLRYALQVKPATRLESIQERAGRHGPWRLGERCFSSGQKGLLSNEFEDGWSRANQCSHRRWGSDYLV